MSWKERKKKRVFGEHKFQWNYFIRTPHGFIEVYDKRRSYALYLPYSIRERAESKESSEVAPIPAGLQKDVDYFLGELEKYADSICVDGKFKFPSYSNQGVLILNPYEIHYSSFKYHYKLLRMLIKKLDKFDDFKTSMLNYEIEHLNTSSFILLIASFEGFVNLVYEYFLNPEIREDDNIVDRINSEKIESKIKMLPVYCSGFKNDVSSINKTLQEFKKLYTLRNKLVHANLSRFKYNNMTEIDGFLFYSGEDIVKEDFLAQSAYVRKKVKIKFLDEAKNTIDCLIRGILMLMTVKQRKEFRRIIHDYWVGYIYTKKGIKFLREEIY